MTKGSNMFQPSVIDRILEAAAVGCSQETAAAVAGVGQATVSRWLSRGRKELETATDPENLPRFAKFARDWEAAQGATNKRALGIIYREMETDPKLAWKYVERREKGYAPPAPALPDRQTGPLNIQLTLNNGAPIGAIQPRTVIDVEEPDASGSDAVEAVSEDFPARVIPLADGSSD